MIWKCRVCVEKDARIADLKEQIQSLRLTLNPPMRVNKFELEETVVLNGGGQEIIPEEEDSKVKTRLEGIREAEVILSGNDLEVPAPKDSETDLF